MLIEYHATPRQDDLLERIFEKIHISEWFNPSENYYVIETDDDEVIEILASMNIRYSITKNTQ